MAVFRSFRYSKAFKLEVVKAMESGRFGSICEAKRHFGIKGATTIRRWLLAYGKNHLIPKVVRVEKPDEQSELMKLRAQVADLEQALGQTHADNLLNDAFFRLVCEKYGEDPESFKKKANTERSTPRSTTRPARKRKKRRPGRGK
jgi:transposase